MTGLITVTPEQNSYMLPLIDAYKRRGVEVINDKHNFFFSNVSVDFVHIHWPELLYQWDTFVQKNDQEKLYFVRCKIKLYKENFSKILLIFYNIQNHIVKLI
ncbi:MAG: hypothetical protein CR986_06855 [Ignavibacteriae bacterium]|nr:MAG: hypothetical protein CR986_06855 [Ignavibacteriota bacterium]